MQGLLEAEFDKILNGRFLYLVLEKSDVIFDKLMNGGFGKEAALVSANHGLCEEQIDPLRHIILVDAVIFDG